MDFSGKLRSYRIKAGLTQAEVSKKLSISRQSISKWENGSITPSLENLQALSQLYSFSLDDLFDNKHNKKSKDESISLLVITVVCALIPLIDLIGPFYVLKRNKKENEYYRLLKFLNYACFVLSIISYIWAYFLSEKFL